MKGAQRILPFLGLALVLCSSWGFYGHRNINRLAVYTLPDPLMRFYKQHADYLSGHAVDADKRRYSSDDEAPRHYLDADYYEQALPFDTLPSRWKDAVEKFSEDTLIAYGIGPWHLERMVWRLQKAFEERNSSAILKLSADLGHYAGDLHVPLHSTLNYNGQLSGQKGIHSFWESRLPELFAGEYDFYVGKAVYIERLNEAIWEAFSGSFAARDSVLELERELNARFPEEEKYAFEEKGNGLVKVYAEAYARAYHEALKGMVERRMRASLYFTGCLWYTAWVNAGSPDLDFGQLPAETDSTLIEDIRKDKELERKTIPVREEN